MEHINSRRAVRIVALALALGPCAACSDSDPAPPPPAFGAFVTGLIDQTAEDTEPVDISGQTFTFSEDPAAFDGLFP